MKAIALILAFATLAKTGKLDRSVDEPPMCTYTFNVPSTNGEPCLPGATSDGDVQAVRTEMTKQHGVMNGKLDRILKLLEALNCTDGGGTTNPTPVTGCGVNYIRWGRTECPDTAQLIYEGYMGKSHYSHSGGGSNYLCLSKEPEFPEGVLADHQSQSYIWGVEYEKQGSPLIDSNLHDHDAPCAVCEAQNRSQQLMIPGKLSCPTGWTEEYDGVLMAEHHTHHGSSYVCVSNGMEMINSGVTNDNGGLLYVVEAVCGALPCPEYVSGYEIGCVVCTK